LGLEVLQVEMEGVAGGDFGVVGDEDQSGAGFLEVVVDDSEGLVAAFAVEGGCGFVGENQLGGSEEGAEDGDALAFALGEVGGGAVEEVGDVEAFGELGEGVSEGGAGGVGEAEEAGGEEAVFGGGEVVEEGEVLEDEADVLEAPGAEEGSGELVEGEGGVGDEGAGGGAEEAAEEAEEGGFADAAGAGEEDGLAGGEGELGQVEGEVGAGVGELKPGGLEAGRVRLRGIRDHDVRMAAHDG
jgi:hypothetical protein